MSPHSVSARDRLLGRIETTRLCLRQPVPADLADLVRQANDWAIVEPTASLPFPYEPAHGRAFLERFIHKADQRPYAIADRDDRLMGIIGLKFYADKPPELGYWLGRAHWGQGLAAEAVAGLLLAAPAAGIERIAARVLKSNPASARVLEKCGFRLAEETVSVVERHHGKPLLIFQWSAP